MSAMLERDDRSLCAALREGDEDAFAELLDRFDAPLRRFAMTFVRNAAIADEVVQDTWLGVIRGIDRFEERSSLKTWIFQILANNARTRAVREARTIPLSAMTAVVDDESSVDPSRFLDEQHERWPGHWAAPLPRWSDLPEAALAGRETLGVLRQAIETLPEMQRRVIVLRDVEGWPSEEVCDLLSLTEANQRVLLHRARSRVRAALEVHLVGAEL